MCVASYSLRRVRGTTIAAELAFVCCLIYFKNDVQTTIASLLTAIVSCPRRMWHNLMSPFSRPQPTHQEEMQCQIHIRMCIFKLQVLIDNCLPLFLMACPITLNLALKTMRNH